MRLLSYVVVAVLSVAFAWQLSVMRDNVRAARSERADLAERVLQLEIHDCGLTQYEDYSVAPQVMDWVRRSCVEAMRAGRDPRP